MSDDSFVLDDFESELVKLDVPPQEAELLRPGEAGKGEPKLVAWVKPGAPESIDELNRPVSELTTRRSLAANPRNKIEPPTEDEIKAAEKARYENFAESYLERTSGATLGVVNFLLAPVSLAIDLEKSPTLAALFEEKDGRKEVDLGKHPKFAAFLLEKCRDEELYWPLLAQAADAARAYAKQLQGKGDG